MTLLVAVTAMSAFAQGSTKEDWAAPYWWVGLQGGVASTINSNNYKFGKAAPTGSIALGYMIAPEAGLRLHANAPLKSSGVEYTTHGNSPYNLSYVTADLDALINLCTIFGSKDYYPLNFYLIMGLGYNDLTEKYNGVDVTPTPANIKDNGMNLRLGAQLEWNIAKHWSITAEGNVNSDRIGTAQLGINYKFGMKKAPKPVEIVAEPAPAPAPAPAVKKEVATPKPAPAPTPVAKQPENIEKNVFFTIGKSAVVKDQAVVVDEAAKWLKDHETATATVTGYADKGTGSAAINKKISQKRAVAVADMLKAKGIAADRISIDSKGDTVQPFAENDKNRVVLIIATEK